MPNREDFLTLKHHIEQKGGTDVELDDKRRGNPRLYFTYRGIRKFITTVKSASDVRTIENHKSYINQVMSDVIDITPNYIERREEVEIKAPSLEVPQTFGERLRYAREQQQMSRERLAELSNLDPALIKRFEDTKQETLKDLKTALLLSTALKTTLVYLVGEQTAKEFNMSEVEAFNPALPNKVDEIAKAIQVTRQPEKEKPAVEPTALETSRDFEEALYNDVNTLEDLATFFKLIRARRKLTQMDVAEAMDMSYPSEVSRVERGLWTGGVYRRYIPFAKVLGVPIETMRDMLERVKADARQRNLVSSRGVPTPRVSQPEPEVVRNVTGSTPGPTEPFPLVAPATIPTATSMQMSPSLTGLQNLIREQAEITRALMRSQYQEQVDMLRSQHQELVDILKTIPTDSSPADMLHTIIHNLFRKD